MITIQVFLHTILQIQTPQGSIRNLEVSLPDGSTLSDLLKQLNITLSADQIMLVINGHVVEETYQVQNGDQVNLMPAISGG